MEYKYGPLIEEKNWVSKSHVTEKSITKANLMAQGTPCLPGIR